MLLWSFRRRIASHLSEGRQVSPPEGLSCCWRSQKLSPPHLLSLRQRGRPRLVGVACGRAPGCGLDDSCDDSFSVTSHNVGGGILSLLAFCSLTCICLSNLWNVLWQFFSLVPELDLWWKLIFTLWLLSLLCIYIWPLGFPHEPLLSSQ